MSVKRRRDSSPHVIIISSGKVVSSSVDCSCMKIALLSSSESTSSANCPRFLMRSPSSSSAPGFPGCAMASQRTARRSATVTNGATRPAARLPLRAARAGVRGNPRALARCRLTTAARAASGRSADDVGVMRPPQMRIFSRCASETRLQRVLDLAAAEMWLGALGAPCALERERLALFWRDGLLALPKNAAPPAPRAGTARASAPRAVKSTEDSNIFSTHKRR